MYSFEQLLQAFYISFNDGANPYNNPNMTSEHGIAIYGNINSNNISFFEVDRMYDLIQKKAKELGYNDGEIIPKDLDFSKQENNSIYYR